jgi:hypothetical protein
MREPTDGRFFLNTEITAWINRVIEELASKLGYEKKIISFLGNTHIAALGTDPRYFEMPTDFMTVDFMQGVAFDNIRRLGAEQSEIDQYQEAAVAAGDEPTTGSTTTTISPADYYSAGFTGAQMHYSLDRVIVEQKTNGVADYTVDQATKLGKLMWFVPNPIDTTVIRLMYHSMPAYLSADTDKTNFTVQFQELLVYGACIRMAQKKVTAGQLDMGIVNMYKGFFDEKLAEAMKYQHNAIPDKLRRIKTAREVFGSYHSSSRRNRGGVYSTED